MQRQALAALSKTERDQLAWTWAFTARPEQLIPAGDWTYWLVLAGRGFGKTRTGAETVRQWIKDGRRYVNLIGATAADARDVMVEGESGILAVCPKWERPEYKPSQRKLVWPTGAESLIFSADEPDRLRGPQHDALYCDEIAAWRYAESWQQAQMGLRLGHQPRVVITTTPRPTKLIRELIADPATHVTRGKTYDNRAHLAPSFFDAVLRRYEGTRLGRQEIDGEVLDDNPGALFRRDDIDKARVLRAPDLQRIVVAIDPAATSSEGADDTGIVAAGVALVDGVQHGYILHDLTCHDTPMGWAKRSVAAYADLKADRIIGEANNGGDMIEDLIRTVDASVSYRKVTATRGKQVRAEPIASLYEQCIAAGTLVKTASGEVPIEMVRCGDLVWTRDGLRTVTWSGQRGVEPTLDFTMEDGSKLSCTAEHRVFVEGRGFIHAEDIVPKCDMLLAWTKSTHAKIAESPSKASAASHVRLLFGGQPRESQCVSSGSLREFVSTRTKEVIGEAAGMLVQFFCTALFGRLRTVQSVKAGTSITSTAIQVTTRSATSRPSAWQTISAESMGSISRMLRKLWSGCHPSERSGGASEWPPSTFAMNAKPSFPALQREFDSAHRPVTRPIGIDSVKRGKPVPVYDLTVEGLPEFFAAGVLVHNCRIHHVGSLPKLEDEMCEWDPLDATARSPNRLDAMVWALTELMLNGPNTALIDYLKAHQGAQLQATTHGATSWRD